MSGQSQLANYKTKDVTKADMDRIVGRVRVIKSGDYVYIRSPWTSTLDYVCKIWLNAAAAADSSNNCVDFTIDGTIPASTADADVPFTSIAAYKVATDDITPVGISGQNIGGHHGVNSVITVTSAAHGKTAADVGSLWHDTAAAVWVLAKIQDANTLWFLPNTNAFVTTAMAAGNLAHTSGAAHVGDIAISAKVTSQLVPAVNNHIRRIVLDGRVEQPLSADWIASCDFADIIHDYDILDPNAVRDFLKTHVGSNPAPALNDAAITKMASIAIVYRFSENGACTIFQSMTVLEALILDGVNFVQASCVGIPGGGSRAVYASGIAAYTDAYGIVFGSTGLCASTSGFGLLDSTHWIGADQPPNRFITFSTTSGGAKSAGFAIGVNTEIGLGVPAARKLAANNNPCTVYPTKLYPVINSGTSTAGPRVPGAGTVFDAVCYRCPINYNIDPNATALYWYYVGDVCYLCVDYHATFAGFVPLPKHLVGRKAAIVETNGAFVLKSSHVTPAGVFVSATNWGGAIIKLTK